jgi:hypothetical protein
LVKKKATIFEDASFLGSLAPEDVFLYYDGPRTFTARSSTGDLLIVSWLDEKEKSDLFMASIISAEKIQALRQNHLTLRDALDPNVIWLVEQDLVGRLSNAELVTIEDIDRRFPNSLPRQERK